MKGFGNLWSVLGAALRRSSLVIFFSCLVTILFVSLTLVLGATSQSHAGGYLQSEAEIKGIASDYVAKNKSSEAFLVDLLVNGRFHSPQAANLPGAAIYYYYEAQEHLHRFGNKKTSSLEPALKAIDTAIAIDPATFNYFFKSYLLYKQGKQSASEQSFAQGLKVNAYHNYMYIGSKAFVRMLKQAGITNEHNAFCFLPSVSKLTIDGDFLFHTIKKLRKLLKDPNVNRENKKAVYCGMISYVNSSVKAFYFIQDSAIYMTTKLLEGLPKEATFCECKMLYELEALKERDDFKRSYDRYRETGNTNFLTNSIYWRNFQSISRDLKTAR